MDLNELLDLPIGRLRTLAAVIDCLIQRQEPKAFPTIIIAETVEAPTPAAQTEQPQPEQKKSRGRPRKDATAGDKAPATPSPEVAPAQPWPFDKPELPAGVELVRKAVHAGTDLRPEVYYCDFYVVGGVEIDIERTPDALEKAKALLAAESVQATVTHNGASSTPEAHLPLAEAAAHAQDPTPVQAAPVAEPVVESVKPLSLDDDLRPALQRYTVANGMNAGMALLKKYGAQRISEMMDKDATAQAAFMAECPAKDES